MPKTTQHADFNNQWVPIFRAGTYPKQGSWNGEASTDDLTRVVGNYDPQFHEAPLCAGHPKDNLPAYGWVDRLMVSGDTLYAKFRKVDPQFEEAVKAERFKKRSAAFYLGEDGKIAGLRHVGFLGAMPPEVKGLADLNFDDAGRSFAVVEFGEEDSMAEEKTIREQVAAYLSEILGGKKQNDTATFSEDDVKRIAQEAATAAAAPLQTKIASLETELKAETAKFGERETQLAASETRQRAVVAINALKAKGLWVPAFDKMGGEALFEELAKVTTVIEFGEPDKDGKKAKTTPLQMMVTFMEGLPKVVPAGKLVGMGTEGRVKGATGDPLTDAATARAKEKNISFGEALSQVAEESPELASMAGNARGGQV